MSHFDIYGWYTSTPLPGRETVITPANTSETTTPGQQRANWTGHAWVSLPYVTPAPIENPANSAIARAGLIKKIDADTDLIYGAVQGNRGPEYIRAEAEATAYRQAGYAGNVPPSVSSWANAKGWTATQATDDILATATGWRSAQEAIRATRLSLKELARTTNDVQAVAAQWSAFVVTITTALGITATL